MADYITVEKKNLEFEVTFYHVKAMKSKKFNSNVNDIYEVIGQSIKSTIWLKNKQTLLSKIKARTQSNHCEFKKGNLNDLVSEMREQDKVLRGKIVAVQPSITNSKSIPSKIQEILAATNYYICNSGKVTSFEIWGSWCPII